MRRRVLLCFVLALASGCQGDVATKPTMTSAPPPPPSRIISDGNHSNGNPNFFFLPPMVPNPSGSPNWDAGGFDGSFTGARAPLVSICRLNAAAAADVPTAICTSDVPVSNAAAAVDVAGQTYQLNWKVPDVSALTFYRVTVVLLTNQLGVADLEVVPNASQLKNLSADAGLVPLADNRALPIKFRIERGALAKAVVTVNLTQGGTVSTTLPGNDQPSGITIPPQTGATTPLTTFTVSSCDDMHGRITDLPTFGNCVRVTADPSLPPGGFGVPATVFDCNVSDLTISVDNPDLRVVGKVRNHQQADRITLHQYDVIDGRPRLLALPHAPACGATPPVTGSIHGILDDLRHGELKAATKQMLAMVTPKSAYAAMFIDLGGGGFASELSDYQFALPAKFTIDASTDNAMLGPGEAATPTVTVSDLDDQPVSGATVSFAPAVGSTSLTSVVTGADGKASTVWTFGPPGTSATLLVSGRGIAGDDNNGPRDGVVDPFQPIQELFHPSPLDLPVVVLPGSVTFHGTALVSPIGGFGFGSSGFLYAGSAPVGTQTTDFASATYVPQGWASAAAPFGSGGCATPVTPWPINSGILARKSFSTRTASTLSVQVHIDNDIRLWVDGKEITSTGTTADASFYDAASGWWIHDGCVLTNPPTFTASNVPAGNHVLAVWATDRGGDSHFDVSITQAR